MNKFTYKSMYGSYNNCEFLVGYYSNKNIGIEIWSTEEGPITKVTVNPDIALPSDRIAIKNYSENAGMVDFLVSMDMIDPEPIQSIMSGFVEIPVHKLTEKGKKILGI